MASGSYKNLRKIHSYYLQLCEWDISPDSKTRIFGALVANANPRNWRVIAITRNALEVFADHRFKRAAGMGIQRGHVYNRNDVYQHLLDARIQNAEEWWNYYYVRDVTVLMTSSENMQGKHSEKYPIDDNDLFVCAGYSWRHRKEEEAFLKAMHHNMLCGNTVRTLSSDEFN